MAKNLQQYFIYPCGSVFAPYKIPELRFYHKVGCFYVRPKVIMLHKLLSVIDKVVIHLVPDATATRFASGVALVRYERSASKPINAAKVFSGRVSLVRTYLLKRKAVICSFLNKRYELRRITTFPFGYPNPSYYIGLDTAHYMPLDPFMFLRGMVLDLAVVAEGRSPESCAIYSKLGFNAFQRKGRHGYKMVQDRSQFRVHHIVAYGTERTALTKIAPFQSHSHIAHEPSARERGIDLQRTYEYHIPHREFGSASRLSDGIRNSISQFSKKFKESVLFFYLGLVVCCPVLRIDLLRNFLPYTAIRLLCDELLCVKNCIDVLAVMSARLIVKAGAFPKLISPFHVHGYRIVSMSSLRWNYPFIKSLFLYLDCLCDLFTL